VKQAIPISLLFKSNEDNTFDSLRVWVLLKSLHRNTVIYSLNYETLSKKTGISHTTLRKHIKTLCAQGLASFQNNNLHLTGINKLKRHKYEKCVLIPVEPTKTKQILQFRKAILHRNIDNQKKQIQRKSKIVNYCNQAFAKLSKSEMRMIKKAGGVEQLEKTYQSVTTLSNKRIGRLFGLSQITGYRIQCQLRDNGLIKTKTRLELIKKNCSRLEYNYIRNDGGYIYNQNTNSLFIRLSNSIEMQ
jgi:hypothetical protein